MNILLTLLTALLTLISAGLLLIEAVKRFEPGNSAVADGAVEKVLVIVPCRGNDISLQENLLSVLGQEFSPFDAIAVVDSEEDPALEHIRAAGMSFMVADACCERCSGKVRAITSAIEANPGYAIYVIADSDATFEQGWLARLVAPLADAGTGLSTSFPLFVPLGGFWSKVKMVWGFVGTSMMESTITRFGWGGSLAFRRGLLDGAGLASFREAVSDDSALTKLARESGGRIAYCGGTLVTVKSRETFGTFREWSNRQTALAIHNSRHLYGMGIGLYGSRLLLLVSSIILSAAVSPLYLLLLAPFALNLAKIYIRSGSRDPLLIPIFLAMDAMYMANLLRARRMRTISWRGREYSISADGL